MEINKIYCENNLETMARMENEFIDLTVTSPPYDNLRDYKGYEFDFESTAKELYRVTKKGGVVVWVVGDSTIDGSESGTSFKQALFFKETGFKLHDTMIYKKNSPAFNDNTRYGQVFEYIFILSKGRPKSVNLLNDRKNKWDRSFGKTSFRGKDGELVSKGVIKVKEFGVRFNIWEYANGYGFTTKDEHAYKHPAMFPEQLAADNIYSWSNKGDLVYDPFMGSGTVAKMAHIYQRNWVGSEISKEYCELAEKRIKPYLLQTQLFQ